MTAEPYEEAYTRYIRRRHPLKALLADWRHWRRKRSRVVGPDGKPNDEERTHRRQPRTALLELWR